MALEGLYGDRLAKLFPIIGGPNPIIVKSINQGGFAATRVTCDALSVDRSDPTPCEEAFALCLRLKNQRAELWLDGRGATKNTAKDETTVYDLRSEIMMQFKNPFDFLCMSISRRALIEIANQEGAASADFSVPLGRSFADPIVAHLGSCLLPALDSPHAGSNLFIEHVAMAIQTHFLARYVTKSKPVKRHRSGLTARQLRIAKHAISENIDGGMSLNAIARECGLSPSHFTRAFAISVGQPPYQWLLEQRVDRACQLLGESALPLADIAIQCGFADQSHFTRVFSARAGVSPGRWRRVRRF
jgi:AraC family transcriptional regulator